ncbi:MAG: family 10 glycosylhydrolase, partial [Candidatus Hadarchaeales archaeon]
KRYWKTEWFAKTQSGQMKSDGGFFFDPGNPAVRAHIANVATEIVKNYNVDGIHFDFIRYTDLGNEALLYGDASNYWFADRTDSVNGNPWNLNRNDFARLNIERLLKMVADSVKKYKPWVKIGTTTPGIYTAAAMGLNCPVWELYSQLRSDPKAWAAKGYIDYHNPQIYWNMATCPEFTKVANWWKNNLSGRQAWMGLAEYRIGEPNFGYLNEIKNQIIYTRLIGGAGVNFFRFRSMVSSINYLDSLAQDLFRYPANVPPMPWKDPVPPNPPTNLTIQKISVDRYKLIWNRPQVASDGEVAEYYNIFRSTQPIDQNNHTHLYKITASADTFFFDTISDTTQIYYYAVSALDKLDFVWVHVEAPDEAGHEGDPEKKVKTIEDLDRRLIGRILNRVSEVKIAVLPDHPTPVDVRLHMRDPVPFVIWREGMEGDGLTFCEASGRLGSLGFLEGEQFMEKFLKI